MLWLKDFFLAVLEWLTSLTREDKVSSDADKTPEKLKDAWAAKIKEMEAKEIKDDNTKTDPGT